MNGWILQFDANSGELTTEHGASARGMATQDWVMVVLSNVSISLTVAVLYFVTVTFFFSLIFFLIILEVTDCNWDRLFYENYFRLILLWRNIKHLWPLRIFPYRSVITKENYFCFIKHIYSCYRCCCFCISWCKKKRSNSHEDEDIDWKTLDLQSR